jgi:hypothetical protein
MNDTFKFFVYLILWLCIGITSHFLQKSTNNVQIKKNIKMAAMVLMLILIFIFGIWIKIRMEGLLTVCILGFGVIGIWGHVPIKK